MQSRLLLAASAALVLLASAACETIAPPPAPTAPPTATATPAPTATVTPTTGPREFLDAGYCWQSHIDDAEFNLVRFFGNGVVVDVFVQPFADCDDAWTKAGQFLTLENANTVSHGEYFLSGEIIRLELAKPNSNEIVGEVNGVFMGGKLILYKQGTEGWEYVLVYGGE